MAASSGLLAHLGAAPAAASEAGKTLTSERAATYAGLSEAVAVAGHTGIAGKTLKQAQGRFADAYKEGSSEFRAAVNQTLDTLHAESKGQFAERSVDQRLALLREWVEDTDEAKDPRALSDEFDERGQWHTVLAQSALQIGNPGCYAADEPALFHALEPAL